MCVGSRGGGIQKDQRSRKEREGEGGKGQGQGQKLEKPRVICGKRAVLETVGLAC